MVDVKNLRMLSKRVNQNIKVFSSLRTICVSQMQFRRRTKGFEVFSGCHTFIIFENANLIVTIDR